MDTYISLLEELIEDIFEDYGTDIDVLTFSELVVQEFKSRITSISN